MDELLTHELGEGSVLAERRPEEANSDVLRSYWHPVAASSEVADRPMPALLLDEPLVLWRADGKIAAFRDLCIHRGTPLSLGSVIEDRLVCAYHGWQYANTGACTLIPSLPPERGIPNKARAISRRAEEKYGLIWVCLGDPAADIPELPAVLNDSAFDWDFTPPEQMRANAARIIENNMDQSHFAFVHRGVLAVDPHVEDIHVTDLDDGLTYDVENPTNTMRPKGSPERTRFRLILPFTLIIDKYSTGGPEHNFVIFIVSPQSSKESRVFAFAGRNFRRYSRSKERAHRKALFEQDRVVVEAQRPEELPLDLREELHLRGPDAAALAFRKRLGSIGVQWG